MIGKVCELKINGQTASKRTRNRIREHGPRFIIVDNPNRPGSTLVQSVTGKWIGWLPNNEFIVVRAMVNVKVDQDESIEGS